MSKTFYMSDTERATEYGPPRQRVNITLDCCMCGDRAVGHIYLPDGWGHLSGALGLEDIYCDAFCAEHAAMLPFLRSECSGCTEDWGECGLWQGFDSGNLTLSNYEMKKLRSGVCPRKVVGGKFVKTTSLVGEIDHDIVADSGGAVCRAIEDYVDYHGGRMTDE